MFKVIFLGELTYWKRNPLTYVYGILLFSITLLAMWGMAVDEVSGPNLTVQNAPHRLNYLANYMNQLMIFILPSIIGASIYRDYSSDIYHITYSYPFSRHDYLFAKFCSAFLIAILIVLMMAAGFSLGAFMPGVNPEAVRSFEIKTYLTTYLLQIIPNLFLISVLIFALVAHTRNIYLGFVAIILVIIFHSIVGYLPEPVASFIDPSGASALRKTTKYWTLSDRNNMDLPVSQEFIINRILWTLVALISGTVFVVKFRLGQFTRERKSRNKISPENVFAIPEVSSYHIPNANISLDFKSRVKTIWRLSTFDFLSIISSWPFILIITAGFILVFIQQRGMAPQHGVPILPTTSEMLRIPMFIFSAAFNLLTFLYTGILLFRDDNSRMQELTYSTPQPNWVFLFTRFIAILKMQLVILTVILVSGLIVQTVQGYYRYELSHYLFELYIIHLLHFMIWACVALFVHSLFSNMYVSFILLLLIPVGVLLLPAVGDTLGLDLLKEHFLHFNHVPGLYVGFDYSHFNQYGTALPVYFFYKLYWSLGGAVFLLLALLVWRRNFTFSFRERWQIIKSRFRGKLGFALSLSLLALIFMGANVYYQEHHVSNTFYTEAEEDYVYAQNEIRYGHLLDRPQPKLKKAVLYMDIYPTKRDYHLYGSLFYVNPFTQPIDTILVGTSFKDDVQLKMITPSNLLTSDDELRYYTYILKNPLQYHDTLRLDIDIKNHPNTLLHNNSRVLTNGTFITNQIIPTLGVRQAFLTSKGKRKKYGLGEKETRPLNPSDSTLLGDAFFANNMGRIDYETFITTSSDQRAFSMGNLINTREENGRNHFHYKSDGPIQNNISWLSGTYLKKEGEFGNRTLFIYHHPWHTDNIPYLQEGALASLNYCEEWFSPLQHDTLHLVEFPMTVGTYATINGNLIPFSESKMLCDIDHRKNDDYNHPFFVAAHEVAHYWWGHKVDPANVYGGKLISESMAEYISKRVIENRFGKDVIRENRKKEQITYFEMRAKSHDEQPLTHARLQQDYLNYVKGGLAITTLSEYIGEEQLNNALAGFEKAHRHKGPPYPTSLEFVDTLRSATPDSLRYLIQDLFETITLYDIKLLDVISNDNSIQMHISCKKYRTDAIGTITEEPPLADYVRIGTYKDGKEEIHLLKVNSPENKLTLNLDYQPDKVVIDPDILLLDINRDDNTWGE